MLTVQISCYGPTSNIHQEPSRSTGSTSKEGISRSDVRSLLARQSVESRNWEDFALTNAAMRSDIPKETLQKLLNLHWTWISPMFMWVYRPNFMREHLPHLLTKYAYAEIAGDMATGGQYYSHFLLIIMCAHSARFGDDKQIGEMLISRARLLLGGEIDKAGSIPTVQALQQLSARDLAFGRISQAWLYSGMAFRMVTDLGLHHTATRISGMGKLGPEDLESRRRLFWSCYFWDK